MTNDEWYERERAAFIAWWESEGQEKFGTTPTMAAGAGWLAKAERVRPEGRPSEEVYRKAERYHWLRGATSEWSALFSEPPKWDGGSWVRLGSRWTGAKLDEVIDAQMGSEPQGQK